MQDSLFQQGVDLMLYGMGTVVVFLAILVLATLAMSWFIRRFFPEPEIVDKYATADQHPPAYADAKLLAVIKAALDQHRVKRG
jgi:oxaloacetate decarboxylase gamma subunit